MALTLTMVAAAERAWAQQGRQVAGVRPGDTAWVPYPVRDFYRLLTVSLRYATGRRFLDAGCGIGTKCLLAASLGLIAEGVERVPAYAAQARAWGVTVHEADLRDWDGYGGYDIVFVNHPLFDDEAEAAYEARVARQLAPGTVLIKGNTTWPPPSGTWRTALHERSCRRGIWVKSS